MRGASPASLQRPSESFRRIWREATDLFLMLGILLALWAVLTSFGRTQAFAREYTVLGFGAVSYLLSRYQRKTDVSFLSVTVIAFMINARQTDLLHGLSLAWAVGMGIALFQSSFLGLRYKLLFSRVPETMKGWPVLCLLAGSISIALWGVARLVF